MDVLGRIPFRTSKHSLRGDQSQEDQIQLLRQEPRSFVGHRPDNSRVIRAANYSSPSIGMFSKRPDVVTARVSIAYWQKQMREATDEDRITNALQSCQSGNMLYMTRGPSTS